MEDIIDHEFTNNAVCPYCGYVDKDSWELSDNDDETQCASCDKVYSYKRNVSITYSTKKMKYE